MAFLRESLTIWSGAGRLAGLHASAPHGEHRCTLLGLRSRRELILENLALRQQLATVLQKRRPRIGPADRAFWVVLRRLSSRWSDAIVIMKPETVIGWHRAGFALYWKWLSRRGRLPGRPAVGREVRDLVRRMASENRWGAPRIHGELLKLGLKRCRQMAPGGTGETRTGPTAAGRPDHVGRVAQACVAGLADLRSTMRSGPAAGHCSRSPAYSLSLKQTAGMLRQVGCNHVQQYDRCHFGDTLHQELREGVMALLVGVAQLAEAGTRPVLLLGLGRLHPLAPGDDFRICSFFA